MASTTLPGATFKLADDLILTRMGYGAMQLAGPHVFGPPKDHHGAIAVLREVVRLSISQSSQQQSGPKTVTRMIRAYDQAGNVIENA
jgi:pyridoxine 4-dehydrogenase